MNKFILSIALCCFAFVSSAQFTVQDDASTTKSVTNLSIISPAITHEIALGKRQTIFISGELELISRFERNAINNQDKSYFGLQPQLTADFRHYYNFEKRLTKGKNISNNSGNYLALRTMYTFDPVVNKDQFPVLNTGLIIGGVWGIQRIYNSGIYLGLSLGAGMLFGTQKFETAGIGNFHLGFNVASSKKN
ncbi:MAG: hypothetical protein MUF58_10590 [Arcicella sp.]|jgi:hypothetical protein|nr:hypothetical protein [Arcicella sp.]